MCFTRGLLTLYFLRKITGTFNVKRNIRGHHYFRVSSLGKKTFSMWVFLVGDTLRSMPFLPSSLFKSEMIISATTSSWTEGKLWLSVKITCINKIVLGRFKVRTPLWYLSGRKGSTRSSVHACFLAFQYRSSKIFNSNGFTAEPSTMHFSHRIKFKGNTRSLWGFLNYQTILKFIWDDIPCKYRYKRD